MTDKAVSALTSLTGANTATGDLLYIVDISEAAAADRSKKITVGDIFVAIPNGTNSAPSIAFASDPDTGIFRVGANSLGFAVGGTHAATIDSSGRVGVGTPTPSYKLETSGTQNNNDIVITNTTISSSLRLQMIDANGAMFTTGSYPLLLGTANTERGRVTSGGYFKASDTGAYLNAAGAYYEFINSADETALFARATNASYTGTVFIPRASRNTTNNSWYFIGCYHEGASGFKMLVADSGNVTNVNNSYGAISDQKLKQDIVDAGSQWGDIKGLRVRKFRYKADPAGPLQLGLVAQEAEVVSPGLIEEHPDYEEVEIPAVGEDGQPLLNEDGSQQMTKESRLTGTSTKAVKYSVLYMKAVKALQEAMTRIEQLEAKVAALEAK